MPVLCKLKYYSKPQQENTLIIYKSSLIWLLIIGKSSWPLYLDQTLIYLSPVSTLSCLGTWQIPGMLCARQEYTLDQVLVHHRASLSLSLKQEDVVTNPCGIKENTLKLLLKNNQVYGFNTNFNLCWATSYYTIKDLFSTTKHTFFKQP